MNKMEPLEDDLRQALRHVPAPDGFTDRVMARVAEGRHTQQRGRALPGAGYPSPKAWWNTAVAAVLMGAASLTGWHMHEAHKAETAREAAQAQAQLSLALEITNRALDDVQRDLDRSPAGRYTRILNAGN